MNKQWNEMTTVEKLTAAITNAKAMCFREDGVNYFTSCCLQRDPRSPERAGPVFAEGWLAGDSVETRLFKDHMADWAEYPDCPNLLPGTEAYVLRLEKTLGYVGVCGIDDLKDSDVLTVDDRKGTGFASVITDAKSEKPGSVPTLP